jgi:hypothetical protein
VSDQTYLIGFFAFVLGVGVGGLVMAFLPTRYSRDYWLDMQHAYNRGFERGKRGFSR